MTAFVEILSGPQAGARFALSGGRKMLVGRDVTCDVVLSSQMVSRHHARFSREGESFYVEDLETVNGTFVNMRRIAEPTPLKDRDQVNLSNVALAFHAEELVPAQPGGEPIEITLPQVPADQQSPTSAAETVILGAEKGAPETAPEVRVPVPSETRLHSILEITRKLGSSLDIDHILPRVLDILFEAFPHAVNGQILLMGNHGELIPKALKQGREDDSDIFSMTPVNSAVARKVVQTGEVVLFDDEEGESVLDDSFCSTITAPIVGPSQQPLGVIHLECSSSDRRFDKADLELLTAVTAITGRAVEYVQTHEALLALDRRQHELHMAREVQLRMLPQIRPQLPGYSLHDYYASAEEVGGDFYDYFRLADGRIVATIGDVSGKGIGAAMRMAQFVSETRHSVKGAGSIKRAMQQLNQAAWGDESHFITFLLCLIDHRQHTATIAQAGHLPPLWRHGGSKTIEVLDVGRGGLPLGVVRKQEFHPATYHLAPGDSLLLYTDGLTEAVNPKGQLYGCQRICQAMESVSSGPAPLVRFLVSDLETFRGGLPSSDDTCMICLARNA